MNTINFERPSLTEIAYKEIHRSICQGELGPGYKLVVEDLVKAYKISNTPIKEALNRLVVEGLVEAVPRKGMQVKKLAPKDIIEIYDMRLMYETFSAERAVKVIGYRKDVATRLLEVINDFEELVQQEVFDDHTTHIGLDQELHLTIVSLAENEMLLKEYKKISAVDRAFNSYVYRHLLWKKRKNICTEHNAIYQALISQDRALLVEAIRMHIESVKSYMLTFANNGIV